MGVRGRSPGTRDILNGANIGIRAMDVCAGDVPCGNSGRRRPPGAGGVAVDPRSRGNQVAGRREFVRRGISSRDSSSR